MKKIIICFMFIGALYSCKENIVNDIEENKKQSIIMDVADFEWEYGTRSIPILTDAGVSYLWQPTDTVGIFPSVGSQIEFIISSEETISSAAFDGGAWTLKESYTYTAFYPFNYYNRKSNAIMLDYTGQFQNGNDNLENATIKDYIYASATAPEDGITHFLFNHLGAFLWLSLNMDDIGDFKTIKLEADEEVLPIKQNLNLSSGDPIITTIEYSDVIQFSLNNVTIEDKSEPLSFFAILPSITTDNINLSVNVVDAEGNNYIGETSVCFANGVIPGTAYKRTINMIKEQ